MLTRHENFKTESQSLQPLLCCGCSLFIRAREESKVLNHVYTFSVTTFYVSDYQAYGWWCNSLEHVEEMLCSVLFLVDALCNSRSP